MQEIGTWCFSEEQVGNRGSLILEENNESLDEESEWGCCAMLSHGCAYLSFRFLKNKANNTE